MNAPFPHLLSLVGLLLVFSPLAAKPQAGVIHLMCKVAPSGQYTIRIDEVAEVMWVHGTRLKLQPSETEYVATEFPGEPKELKAEYRINRQSKVLRRTSYGLNGEMGTSEGKCTKSAPPAAKKAF
jgi:hypothetical protein